MTLYYVDMKCFSLWHRNFATYTCSCAKWKPIYDECHHHTIMSTSYKWSPCFILWVYETVGSKMAWVDKNQHGPNLLWYVKLKWATTMGVKGDLCKYVACQCHVHEGKPPRFVVFLFMWPRPLVEMVGFIISFPKTCLRFFMDCVRAVNTYVPYSHAYRTYMAYIHNVILLALFNFINGLQEVIPHTKMAITKHSLVFYSWWGFQ